jgi:hypothetical protein
MEFLGRDLIPAHNSHTESSNKRHNSPILAFLLARRCSKDLKNTFKSNSDKIKEASLYSRF